VLVEVIIESHGEKLFGHVAEISDPAKPGAALDRALEAFAKANPGISISDESIAVRFAFDKV
jgi:hypothetical protein